MNNNIFKIDNLGDMKYVVSLIDFDYPRSFVCKKDNNGDIELYIFDEYDHGEDFIKWICAQISVDDLDRLNQGLITIEDCFRGPRNGAKNGFIVTSNSGSEIANAELCDNISSFVVNNDTYIDEFIDNTHGTELMSLVYESPFISIVVKPEKYADPMFDATRVSNGSNDLKSMLNFSPYAIETKNNRMCFSHTHSLVMYFEVRDKQIYNQNQIPIDDSFDNNPETREAFNAINTILDAKSTKEQIINAFKGDKKSIEKTNKFISEIRKNNGGYVAIQTVDYSKGQNLSSFNVTTNIDSETAKNVKSKALETIKIIDSTDNHIIKTFNKKGQFLMLNIAGRKKFKFQSTEKDDYGKIYSGFSDVNLNKLEVDDNETKIYEVVIESDVLKGDFGLSKPIYKLIKIVREIIDKQQSLF